MQFLIFGLIFSIGQGLEFDDLGKIVEGIDAIRGTYPYHVGIVHKNWGYQCGGSIIHPYWILTAAHCLDGFQADVYEILAGDHDITKNDGETRHNVEKIIKHEKWNFQTIDNDIALMKLKDPIMLIPGHTATIDLLKSSNRVISGEKAIITGWGKLYEDGPTADILQVAEIEIISLNYCKTKYTLSNGKICAGTFDGVKDSCNQDSGGPMVVNRNGIWVQAGVVSYGKGCAVRGYPGVYADVAFYNDWIKRRMATN